MSVKSFVAGVLFVASLFLGAKVVEPVCAQENVPVISVAEVKAALAAKEPLFLLDVREPSEYAEGHLDGALLMSLGTVGEAYTKLPKDKKIVVYCRSGKRSAKAVSMLKGLGVDKAVSMDGGYMAWSAAQ